MYIIYVRYAVCMLTMLARERAQNQLLTRETTTSPPPETQYTKRNRFNYPKNTIAKQRACLRVYVFSYVFSSPGRRALMYVKCPVFLAQAFVLFYTLLTSLALPASSFCPSQRVEDGREHHITITHMFGVVVPVALYSTDFASL